MLEIKRELRYNNLLFWLCYLFIFNNKYDSPFFTKNVIPFPTPPPTPPKKQASYYTAILPYYQGGCFGVVWLYIYTDPLYCTFLAHNPRQIFLITLLKQRTENENWTSLIACFQGLSELFWIDLVLLQNLHKKMTQAQFIENLGGLCDGKDYPKELLKVYCVFMLHAK